jgi:hypothetical protein
VTNGHFISLQGFHSFRFRLSLLFAPARHGTVWFTRAQARSASVRRFEATRYASGPFSLSVAPRIALNRLTEAEENTIAR